MKTARAQYRQSIPSIQSIKRHPVKQTRRRVSPLKPLSRQRKTSNRPTASIRRVQLVAVRPQGLGVFSLLVVVAIVLASPFVLALNWQGQAYQSSQKEVALRSQFYQAANERRQIEVEQERARSPRESELRSRRVGLSPLKLDERTVVVKSSTKSLSPNAKSKTGNSPRHPESAPNPARVTAATVLRSNR
jgi:hypothetical protein